MESGNRRHACSCRQFETQDARAGEIRRTDPACFGGEFGGWSLFMKDGKLHYAHNYLKTQEYLVSSDHAVPAGKHQLSVRFTPNSQSLKPDFSTGNIVLAIDGQTVGELQDIKVAGQYSAVTGYGLLVGRNTGTAVSHLYQPPFAFNGTIENLVVKLKQ